MSAMTFPNTFYRSTRLLRIQKKNALPEGDLMFFGIWGSGSGSGDLGIWVLKIGLSVSIFYVTSCRLNGLCDFEVQGALVASLCLDCHCYRATFGI